ncbi:MAG: DUF948 domain-containing protein [Bacillaceae bacterium]|nr:DUF948 domain-containing protein [Bacillaceae bacterium]
MEWVLSVSALLVAASFSAMAVYLILTLKSVSKTLDTLSRSLDGLKGDVEKVAKETEEVLRSTNRLIQDIHKKSESLNGVFQALGGVEKTIKGFNDSLGNFTVSVQEKLERNKDALAQVVQWSSIVLELKSKWEEVRNRKKPKRAEEKEFQS